MHHLKKGWRLLSVDEREVILGFPLEYTSLCMAKHERKAKRGRRLGEQAPYNVGKHMVYACGGFDFEELVGRSWAYPPRLPSGGGSAMSARKGGASPKPTLETRLDTTFRCGLGRGARGVAGAEVGNAGVSARNRRLADRPHHVCSKVSTS